MNNALELVMNDMKRHKVSVKIPGEVMSKNLCLIELKAMTKKLDDFKLTFGSKVTPLHEKLAKKIFGEQEEENTYGVLVDEYNKIIFAFNREFADYDPKKSEIVYKDIDSLLVDNVQPGEVRPSRPSRPRPNDGGFHSGPSMVLRYAIIDKGEKE